MSAYISFIELLRDTDTRISNLEDDIRSVSRDIDRARAEAEQEKEDYPESATTNYQTRHEHIEFLVERNAESALTVMYLRTLRSDLADVLDLVRLTDDVVGYRLSDKAFNVAYEKVAFGGEI